MSELTEEQIAQIRARAEDGALARYREALDAGLSDHEAREDGWPSVGTLADVPALLAEVERLRERRDKAIKRLVRYKADTFLSEQIIAILQGTEAEWYAKYDIKPSGDPS